ncbi:hypothetical protein Bb109J_c0650 [Bdellovibrio bacteriovorus]|uniref:hypothetical protein n=1 Tax=Bdellovibrio bacteriovorus TaxID=959 RepID=UPI00045BEA43|nr:hypothetical protein [Bdellovibrio bacteriovorus]AHZ86790.1 hypothetical protein EP01_17880 [Bdellovibrio bacteriovorus]BEV67230.1 hypothetical protein Bb109J_c0650 [Bdellovibrio bacteriovorus]
MKLILSFLLIGMLSPVWASPLNDGQETNGGDPFVAEFLIALDSALERLPLNLPLENGAAIKREVLDQARLSVVFSSVESLTLDGREVAAVNQPLAIPPKIVMSRTAWRKLNEKQRTLLVLHELLPIVGIFDEDYRNSTALWQLLQPENPITVSAMETAIVRCDREMIGSVSESRFKRMIARPEIDALILKSLDHECPAFIEKMNDWKISMDLCIGSLSLTNWFLRSHIRSVPAAVEILKTLRSQGVPTFKVCAHKVNNSCEQVRKMGPPYQTELGQAMGCE